MAIRQNKHFISFPFSSFPRGSRADGFASLYDNTHVRVNRQIAQMNETPAGLELQAFEGKTQKIASYNMIADCRDLYDCRDLHIFQDETESRSLVWRLLRNVSSSASDIWCKREVTSASILTVDSSLSA